MEGRCIRLREVKRPAEITQQGSEKPEHRILGLLRAPTIPDPAQCHPVWADDLVPPAHSGWEAVQVPSSGRERMELTPSILPCPAQARVWKTLWVKSLSTLSCSLIQEPGNTRSQ